MKIIDSFSGEYEFLSNFYDHEIFYDGRLVWGRPEDVDAVRTSLYTMAFSFVMTIMTWIILCIALQK